MNTDLQNFTIDATSISEDLFGKEGARYELSENKTEIAIAVGKIVSYITLTMLPLLLVIAATAALSLWYYGSIFSPLSMVLGILGGFIAVMMSAFIADNFFTDETKLDEKTGKSIKSENPYKLQKAKIAQLWERRKKLNRFLSVEAGQYDNSQAREIAPLLLARIRKHNKLIESGIRMIELQETMDRNSNSKIAPKLAENITERVKAEYQDLRNRLETYEVMKEMRTDMSLDITAALMDIKDFNKSDLDDFLNEQQENIALLVEDNEKGELPTA